MTQRHQKAETSIGVFLCHSSKDKPVVRRLAQRLLDDGFSPWFDEQSLLPGEDWDSAIQRALASSDIIVFCISNAFNTGGSYLEREVALALAKANSGPANVITLIPARLEDCAWPDYVHRWQKVDLFVVGGYERLLAGLRSHSPRESPWFVSLLSSVITPWSDSGVLNIYIGLMNILKVVGLCPILYVGIVLYVPYIAIKHLISLARRPGVS